MLANAGIPVMFFLLFVLLLFKKKIWLNALDFYADGPLFRLLMLTHERPLACFVGSFDFVSGSNLSFVVGAIENVVLSSGNCRRRPRLFPWAFSSCSITPYKILISIWTPLSFLFYHEWDGTEMVPNGSFLLCLTSKREASLIFDLAFAKVLVGLILAKDYVEVDKQKKEKKRKRDRRKLGTKTFSIACKAKISPCLLCVTPPPVEE